MKKIIIFILLILHIISFGQDDENKYKKWSLGINYMILNNNRFNDNIMFSGFSFGHNIYKRIFIYSGLEYSKQKNYFNSDGSHLTGCLYKYNQEEITNNFIIPIEFCYYIFKNANKTLQPYIKIGLENHILNNKVNTTVYYSESESYDYSNIILNNYFFYCLSGGGLKIQIKPINISVGTFYKSPNLYRLKDVLYYPGIERYNIGFKITISYLFNIKNNEL